MHRPSVRPSTATARWHRRGPTLALHVVGIAAAEFEFPSGQAPEYDLFTTPAFARAVNHQTVLASVYLVRLRHGAADLPRFAAAVNPLHVALRLQSGCIHSGGGGVDPPAGRGLVDTGRTGHAGRPGRDRAGSRSPERGGKRGVSEAGRPGPPTPPAHRAGHGPQSHGGDRPGRPAPSSSRSHCPRWPPSARRAWPNRRPVLAFDPLVLLLGALAAVVVVVALGLWPSVRAVTGAGRDGQSTQFRRSSIVAHLAAAGAPPSMVIGVRHALERGRGSRFRSGGYRAFRHHHRRHRPVCHCGLRRQPVAPDGHARAVRPGLPDRLFGACRPIRPNSWPPWSTIMPSRRSWSVRGMRYRSTA